jgi:hypothetical protein
VDPREVAFCQPEKLDARHPIRHIAAANKPSGYLFSEYFYIIIVKNPAF